MRTIPITLLSYICRIVEGREKCRAVWCDVQWSQRKDCIIIQDNLNAPTIFAWAMGEARKMRCQSYPPFAFIEPSECDGGIKLPGIMLYKSSLTIVGVHNVTKSVLEPSIFQLLRLELKELMHWLL